MHMPEIRLAICFTALLAAAAHAEPSFKIQEIETRLGVGYATRILDMNADKRPDIVVVDTEGEGDTQTFTFRGEE